MDIRVYNAAKERLNDLIERYNQTIRNYNHADISEETIRTWLNEFLGIFGWDVQNTEQVLQERVLRGAEYQRLREINSPHRKPDYILINGTNIKTFLDAKSLDVDIFSDENTAYQIRSYGWSAQVPCAFVSNLEQLVIYDTRFIPQQDQPANMGVRQFHIDEYIDNFDVIFDHIWRENICANHLSELYVTTAIEGRNRVDTQFMATLSSFRRDLAKNLLQSNPTVITDERLLNYYTQVILDRIVFIRVCESKGIESQEKLKSFLSSPAGFWNSFKQSCYMEFYNHYDGAMFSRDERFNQLVLNDEVLNNFVSKLYYPYPYKFDVIPVKVIANIYEEFLGTQLVIDGNDVKEETKDEYIRSNGAIATPEHIVDMVCKQTLSFEPIHTIEDLLKIKILDPCCGSGVFIISCYEQLVNAMQHIFQSNTDERNAHQDYFCLVNDELILTITGRRSIATNCLYAIDNDEAAIEVTKMSLALKIVDGNNPLAWEGVGAFGDKVLREIADNIVLGNTLVDTDGDFSALEIGLIKPMNIRNTFSSVFNQNGGFTYIIGNPPYVETKHYKAAQPSMHAYLSDKYAVFEGKADLAVLFIERSLSLLANSGKAGFIIQRRWFKTDYGSATRELINEGKHLYKLIDFKSTDIFKGRIVYASIMILSNEAHDQLSYFYMPADTAGIRTAFENSATDGAFEGCDFSSIPNQTGSNTWAFENYAISQIRLRLSNQFGTLSNYPGLLIKDGIQALWKKIYHITNAHIEGNLIVGENGFHEPVRVEKDATRAVIYNRVFYPFKNVEPDAYCIFPYEGASSNAISFSAMEHQFPLAYAYLEQNKERIQNEVNCREGDYWHTFTREHNQEMYFVDKIIVPMTAKDTIATFIPNTGLYMDNANVWFIHVPNATHGIMKAITCIMNSTVFSVLGKNIANPQSGGYFKFNKQFLAPIPFPCNKITEGSDFVRMLSELYDQISVLQQNYIDSTPTSKDVFARALEDKWNVLDDICFELYETTEEEKSQILAIGRTVNRIELIGGTN